MMGASFPVYKQTNMMLADMGTKALPDAQFEYLRNQMNGYNLVKLNRPHYVIPSYAV